MLETLSPAKIYVFRADMVFLLQVIAVPLKTIVLHTVCWLLLTFDTVSAAPQSYFLVFFLLCSLPRSACSLHNLATNMTFLQELLVHNELAAVCLIISGAKSPRLK